MKIKKIKCQSSLSCTIQIVLHVRCYLTVFSLWLNQKRMLEFEFVMYRLHGHTGWGCRQTASNSSPFSSAFYVMRIKEADMRKKVYHAV